MNGRLPFYLLAAGCALFAAILFRELTAPDEPQAQAIELAPRPVLAPTPLRPPRENVEALMTTILAHPLFSPTRRPSAKSDEGGPSAGLGDSRLTGIITLPHHRIAIFAVPGGKPLVVGEGEDVRGWRIDSITPEDVSLTGPDGAKTLQPKADPNLAAELRRAVPAVASSQPVPVRAPPLSPIPQAMRPRVPNVRPGLPNMPPGFRPGQR